MDQNDIPYVERKLDRDFVSEEFVRTFGRNATFPRVIKDGELIGGLRETVIYFRDNNYA